MILRRRPHSSRQLGMNGANAAPVPVSPVGTPPDPEWVGLMPETGVELIPYGCSMLRIGVGATAARAAMAAWFSSAGSRGCYVVARTR